MLGADSKPATGRTQEASAAVTGQIAIIVPARDEEASIGAVVTELLHAVPRGRKASVVVVDNGSTDATSSVARRAGARVIREPQAGYGRACLAGLRSVPDAEWIVLADGDGADEPAGLPALLDPLFEGTADLVVGARVAERRSRGSMSHQQRAGNLLLCRLISRLYGVPVNDLGPFRAIRRDRLLALGMSELTYGWSAEMLVKSLRAGYRYREIAVGYRRRSGGTSKVGGRLLPGLRAGLSILRVVFRHAGARFPA